MKLLQTEIRKKQFFQETIKQSELLTVLERFLQKIKFANLPLRRKQRWEQFNDIIFRLKSVETGRKSLYKFAILLLCYFFKLYLFDEGNHNLTVFNFWVVFLENL